MPGYHSAKFGCYRAYKNEDKALLAMRPNNSDFDNDSDHHLQDRFSACWSTNQSSFVFTGLVESRGINKCCGI